MLDTLVAIFGLLFLISLTFGIRARQPLAVVASLFGLATLYSVVGYAMAAMLPGKRLAGELWGIATVLCFTCATTLGVRGVATDEKEGAVNARRTRVPRLLLGMASWTLLAMLLGSATMLVAQVNAFYHQVTTTGLRAGMYFVAPMAFWIAWIAGVWHAIVDPVKHEPPKWLIVTLLVILPGVGAVAYYFLVVLWLNPAKRASPAAPRSETP